MNGEKLQNEIEEEQKILAKKKIEEELNLYQSG